MREVGPQPATVVLRVTTGTDVAVIGPVRELLRRAVGLDVVVQGQCTGTTPTGTGFAIPGFDGTTFIVRAANGIAAYDGVVTRAGNRFALRLQDGRTVAAPFLPTPLHTKLGARVFLAGPLDRAPESYGIIVDVN